MIVGIVEAIRHVGWIIRIAQRKWGSACVVEVKRYIAEVWVVGFSSIRAATARNRPVAHGNSIGGNGRVGIVPIVAPVGFFTYQIIGGIGRQRDRAGEGYVSELPFRSAGHVDGHGARSYVGAVAGRYQLHRMGSAIPNYMDPAQVGYLYGIVAYRKFHAQPNVLAVTRQGKSEYCY